MGSLHWKSRALAAEADCKRLQDEVANLDAARREAEAAAAEMREALGWQPIETLPEFKRAFVGRYSDHVWRQVEAHWYNWAPDGQTPRTNWSWGDRKDPLYGKPTHWHPLIAPPPAAIKETSNG